MNSTRLMPLIRRGLSTTARRQLAAEERLPVNPAHLKMKVMQKQYQIDNGLKIHERGNTFDKALFRITQVLVVVGSIAWVDFAYNFAYPPKA